MNLHLKEVTGKVVNKRLTFNTGMDEFPRYVLEYLIDNFVISITAQGWLKAGSDGSYDEKDRPCNFYAY